jgi:pimeloyl-ACP methyl ester carboxylesterase
VLWVLAVKASQRVLAVGVLVLSLSPACRVQLGQSAIFAPRDEPLPVLREQLTRENIEVTASDGVTLRGWYLDRRGSHNLLLFFHGNGLGISAHVWTLDWLSVTFDASIVAIDQRGFGYSEGQPEFGKLVADALTVHDQALQRYGEAKGGVLVVGQSMGTTPAIRVAAERDVTGLVLLSALSGYRDFIASADRQAPWYVSVEADESLTKLDVHPLRELPRIGAATLFIHGESDPLSTPEVNARLLRASRSPWKKDCPVPGGHASADLTNPLARRCALALAQFLFARP